MSELAIRYRHQHIDRQNAGGRSDQDDQDKRGRTDRRISNRERRQLAAIAKAGGYLSKGG